MRASERFPRTAALFVFLSLVPVGASALGTGLDLDVISVQRIVHSEGASICPGCGPNGEDEIFANMATESSALPGLFAEVAPSVGSDASQTSTVSATELSGSGGISLGFTVENSANSTLTAMFQVATTGTYGIEGDFQLDSFFSGNQFVEITAMGAEVFRRDASFVAPSFAETLQLEAGTIYTLVADVSGSFFGGPPQSAGWSFAIVPEPGTGALLAAGLAVLLASRGRQRARTLPR